MDQERGVIPSFYRSRPWWKWNWYRGIPLLDRADLALIFPEQEQKWLVLLPLWFVQILAFLCRFPRLREEIYKPWRGEPSLFLRLYLIFADPEDHPGLFESWLFAKVPAEVRTRERQKYRRLADTFHFDLLRRKLPKLVPFSKSSLPLPTFDEALERCRERFRTSGRKRLRVLLVQSPNEPEVNPVGNVSCYQPENLWRIASYVTCMVRDVEVALADGTVKSVTEIKDLISKWQPDLVGVSVLTPTINPAKEISQAAKEHGAVVVWGNDHASQNAVETLMGRSFVDVIIRGDSAEPPFAKVVKVLLGKGDIEEVESASWRTVEGVRSNPIRDYPLAEVPLPNPQLFPNFDVYANNFNRSDMYGRWHPQRVTPAVTNFAKGCHWGNVRCTYCDIVDLRLQRMGPRKVWKWIGMLERYYGVNLIYEVCDNFTSLAIPDHLIYKRLGIQVTAHRSWIERLIKARPYHLRHVQWFVYGRADDLACHPEVVPKLRKLGVIRINIGLDHADDRILNLSLRKGNEQGAEANRRTVELLAAHGIQGYFSIVIGAPGETPETLAKVKEFVQWATEMMGKLIVCWDPSILLPLKGGPIWDILTDPDVGGRYFRRLGIAVPSWMYPYFRNKYADFDEVDTQNVARDAMRFYCPDITYEEAEAVIHWIYRLCQERGIVPGGYGIRGLTTGIGTPLSKGGENNVDDEGNDLSLMEHLGPELL